MLHLLLPCNGVPNLLGDLELDKSIAVVALGETLMLSPFVLEDAFAEVRGHSDIERMASAGNDIRKVGPS
jgi:hypothetical protein